MSQDVINLQKLVQSVKISDRLEEHCLPFVEGSKKKLKMLLQLGGKINEKTNQVLKSSLNLSKAGLKVMGIEN